MSNLTNEQLENAMKRLIRRMVLTNIKARYHELRKQDDKATWWRLESELAHTNAKAFNDEYKKRTVESYDYRLE